MNKRKFLPGTIFLLILTVLFLSMVTGCCTKKGGSRKVNTRGSDTENDKKSLEGLGSKSQRVELEKSVDEYQTKDPQLNESRRRKAEQYKRLEYAHEMLKASNPQGALREIERLQMDIRDDTYLEMQTWYLSAMVYHNMGKTSRRKRSMRKMLDCMETLQKDPRFKAAYEDGRISQEVIQMVIGKEGDKYAE